MAQLAQLGQLGQQLGGLAKLAQLAEPVTPAALEGTLRLLVLQGTPFCNINCSYCYLPNRRDKARMPIETVATAVRWAFENRLVHDELSIAWHAGEPLTLPIEWYADAFAAARAAAPPGRSVRHAVQTNGVLLDNAWCDFLAAQDVTVGVSIDGPAALHDAQRRTRVGRGTHAAVMRGIECLKANGVPFHVIAVLTAASLGRADEIVDFFVRHNIRHVGFNIDEQEGGNRVSSLADADVEVAFRCLVDRLVSRSFASDGFRLREVGAVIGCLRNPGFGLGVGNEENQPFAIVTVTTPGDIHTFSPELAGQRHPLFGSFAIGNVARDSVPEILAGERFQTLWQSVRAGVERCAASCAYFAFCQGGAPSNKLAEHGTADATETLHCRLAAQCVTESVLDHLDRVLPTRSRARAL